MSRKNQSFENYSFGLWECQRCGCKYLTKGCDHPANPGDFNEIQCEYYANSRNSWKKHKWKLIEGVSYEEYRIYGGYGAVNREKADVEPAANNIGCLLFLAGLSFLSGKPSKVASKMGGSSKETVSHKSSSQQAAEVKKIQAEEQAVFAREDKEGRFSGQRRLRKKYFGSGGCGCVLLIIIIIGVIFFANNSTKTSKNVEVKSQTVSTLQTNNSSLSSKSHSNKYTSSQVTAFKRALFSCSRYAFQGGINKTEIKDIGMDVIVINECSAKSSQNPFEAKIEPHLPTQNPKRSHFLRF